MAKKPYNEDFFSIEARTFRLLGDNSFDRGRWSPAMDCYETENELFIELHLPGVKRQDIEVSLLKNKLQIKGKRAIDFEDRVKFHRIERPYGIFERTITLPFCPSEDKIEASLKDGILKIVIKKRSE